MTTRLFLLLCLLLVAGILPAQKREVTVTIRLRGVYDSKVSLLGLTEARLFKPFAEIDRVGNGETAVLTVPADRLPGEFVLRFDYRKTEESTPYPSERYFFLNDQDVDFSVSPEYCNNPDSSFFGNGERENAAYAAFSEENAGRKEVIGLLQNLLMNYDDTASAFYRMGIAEYEKRRNSYNEWLKEQAKKDRKLFVSALYPFQQIPDISFTGTAPERLHSLIGHYLDGIDFDNPLIIRLSAMNKWMDGYVNLYGQQATTIAQRDSLFPLAGRTAIEKARKGHPLVYGWMVDYFYRGYEANGIDAGMKILEPYLDDPKCLTSKRLEIGRRLEGMKTLVAGSKAPEFLLKDNTGENFALYPYNPGTKYILLLFWAAGCSHCAETVGVLYPWSRQNGPGKKVSIVAISMDDSENDIKSWREKIKGLEGWKHLNAPEGVRSKVAADYFILSTPVMILLDAGTKEVVATPDTPKALVRIVE